MLRWRIACLVSAAIAVSYLDRQTLPVAIQAIEQDISVTNAQFSFLQSSCRFPCRRLAPRPAAHEPASEAGARSVVDCSPVNVHGDLPVRG
jgi:hypothetical protein